MNGEYFKGTHMGTSQSGLVSLSHVQFLVTSDPFGSSQTMEVSSPKEEKVVEVKKEAPTPKTEVKNQWWYENFRTISQKSMYIYEQYDTEKRMSYQKVKRHFVMSFNPENKRNTLIHHDCCETNGNFFTTIMMNQCVLRLFNFPRVVSGDFMSSPPW